MPILHKLRTSHLSNNPLFDVSRGVYGNASLVHKFGANYDIDTDTDPETVWSAGGQYPWSEFDSAQTLHCISTSASDTGTLEIQGLDANFKLQTKTVTLTGTTAVATADTFIRVFRMRYTDSGGANVGTLTARTVSGAGTVVAQIEPGDGQTLMAIYTVPANYTAYLVGGDITIDANKSAQLQFKIRLFGEIFRIQHTAEFTGLYDKVFHVPLPIPEKSDIDVLVDEVSSPNTRASANFDIILVENTEF